MMVSEAQHETIARLLAESMTRPGDVVEAGCNAGSTSALIADCMQHTGRNLYLFDSFEGLPEESGFGGLMATPIESLELAICNRLDCDTVPDFVQIVEGWFCDMMPAKLPPQIAFAFVDCDVFESAIDALPPIVERLTGVLALHDYTHERWGAGMRRAVEAVGLDVTVVDGMAIVRAEQC